MIGNSTPFKGLAGEHRFDERTNRQQNDRRAQDDQSGVNAEKTGASFQSRLTPISQPNASHTTYAVESGRIAAEKTDALSKPARTRLLRIRLPMA